jgi:biopolymer transport protein ExbD
MPKVKVPRKSTSVDMTAMTDVAFLLLTFFMLATKFKPDEPVVVDTPSSVSQILLPESDVILLTVDKDGRVFFGVDGQQTKEQLVQRMGERYKITFTPSQIKEFSLLSTFGVPIAQLPALLDMKSEARLKAPQAGIPTDSLNNELADWIWQTRLLNKDVRVAIKGDGELAYPKVKQVIATLQDKKVNRFNLITNMEKAD